MALRLTLRTLLAYLDDTLDPAQARAIGQKVAESESARELIERIKQVTRRRRLTTPPTTGPGGIIDPNTVAEYLDNEVTPEQAAEVEQICLSSDVHLAEVAACHQILTLILGEPLQPPASANQRMVGLVKGPEAIPARKTAAARAKSKPEPTVESKDIDETLRLGLPALRRSHGWRNPMILIGGGFVAAILLVLAVFQILHLSGNKDMEIVAQGDLTKDKEKTDKTETEKDREDAKSSPGGISVKAKKIIDGIDDLQTGESKEKKIDDNKDPDSKAAPTEVKDIPFAMPNPREGQIGIYLTEGKDTSILLQSNPAKKIGWKRLTPQKSEVSSARLLLSLPGSRSVVQITRGVRLTLWGNMTPEFVDFPGLFESQVELYSNDDFDLDILLRRGRVVFTSTRSDRVVNIRLRFQNPLIPSDKDLLLRQEHFDIQLQAKGASLLVDRWNTFAATEPFYLKANDPNRLGPTADLACVVLSGIVKIKTADLSSFSMTPPPGLALMAWNSLTGPRGPRDLTTIPNSVLENPPSPPGLDPKIRKDMVRACENLSVQLANKEIDVGLANALKSADLAMRKLVVRSQAAVGDLSGLLEALEQPNSADLRLTAIDALRDWIAAARDNDYKLFDLLKEKYKNKEAEIIMGLLHWFSDAQRRRAGLYELLIDYLVNPNLVIRELGAWHLYRMVPEGKNIPYSAAADSQVRENAERLWRALIPSGQLPSSLAPAVKKK